MSEDELISLGDAGWFANVAKPFVRLLSKDSGGLRYSWEPPNFAIAPHLKPVDVVEVQETIDAARKTSRKKRKRAQEEATATASAAEPLSAIPAGPFLDAIYAACVSNVQQGLDYPQHEGCAAILNAALHRVRQLQLDFSIHEGNAKLHPSMDDRFNAAFALWKTSEASSSSRDVNPWENPLSNALDSSISLNSAGIDWFLPRKSAFLMCNHDKFNILGSIKPVDGFNLVIADPPWSNKSVDRGQKYGTMSLSDISGLNVAPLLATTEPVVVFCWVTNKLEYQRFVLEKLFPSWGVQYSTSWMWLKLKTDAKTPVCPLSGKQRKPYEIVMIGLKNWNSSENIHVPEILQTPRVLACVPSIHSRKPPIHHLLQGMPAGWSPRGLELFARNLLPGFTSWGNEVIKFQQEPFVEFESE